MVDGRSHAEQGEGAEWIDCEPRASATFKLALTIRSVFFNC